MNSQRIGLIGATSLVGQLLLPRLVDEGYNIVAYTRKSIHVQPGSSIQWRSFESSPSHIAENIQYWICVAPIWVLPAHFELLESQGVHRIIVLSSTSRFGKLISKDVAERTLAQRLAEAEAKLQRWSDERKIELVILRPTLIYGRGLDTNVSEISRFILRFGFFPLLGQAQGLRQPIHADDVAQACVAALLHNDVSGRAFNLSGGETLPYKEMVERIFKAKGKKPRLFPVPLWVFGLAVAVLKLIPRYKHWSSAMAQRMNQDLVFDHSEATGAFGFRPRGFLLKLEDLPK
ncbi:NAD-dependent epimerase/dehydratase family protein [Spartinivicinus ruber]|uniref:NAD-dependent epimerase/dehydratase family protein n=1 Tax=Spartinivicinus ruber TaxID=2683272 RepID=UPI0013D08565|nr:NAD-dependent epimerase/dehydratase family protein [Spartinivicinus ruber]